MQRKLIDYAVFEKLQENSYTSAQYELMEAEDILSHALETGPLSFHNFNDSHVLYETVNGTYIRANFQITDKDMSFDNIEEIVVNEESQTEHRREVIRTMLDSILEDNLSKATSLFDEVMEQVREHHKRESVKLQKDRMNEATRARRDPRNPNRIFSSRKKPKRQNISKAVRSAAARKSWATRRRNDPGLSKQARNRRMHHKVAAKAAKIAGRSAKRKMHEWFGISQNVFGYIDFVENNHVLNESVVKTNEQGQVTALKIPTSKVRNEGKILQYGLKTLKADLKILRESARRLSTSHEFCDMISDLKRHNNISDNNALEESIGKIVTKFPSVLYLTQEELSGVIGQSLANTAVTNYDDRTCSFMAEGILRVAHEAYSDRVSRIHRLSNTKACTDCEDPFEKFQETVREFYPSLDEALAFEMRVFEDLHSATVDVRQFALEYQDEELREEATGMAEELESVLQGHQVPSLELAANVAAWLENLVNETNLETSDWEVKKVPHETITGDVPEMWQKAKHPYAPASDFTGDWGDSLPQIHGDKKGYKGGASDETRNRSWGNKGGEDVYPSLSNPYSPKPYGDYTMKGEKGVDKSWESGLATWQSGDTWGPLQNPYIPKSVKVHVNSDNRVDDVISKV